MITINGKKVFESISGGSVVITNGKVIIDGKDMTPEAKEININIAGDVNELEVDYASKIEILGSIRSARVGSGDISCKEITGNAQTGSGDIDCDIIKGDVQTGSGNVNSVTINGSVRTGSGNIKHKN